MNRRLIALPLLAATCAGGAVTADRPNILLILADDLGFSDLGCYGGEVRTPNLDRLGREGTRFTQLYNSARCCPSRASIITGQHPHFAGFPNMSGHLPDAAVTLPEALRANGYRTLMSGKWHLNPVPTERGFDEFFGMVHGFDSFWNAAKYTRLPKGRPQRSYPDGTFYATDAITDHALDFIGAARSEQKPWFLYLAYNAPHFPLHAPQEDIARYADTYRIGWDAIRAARLTRQKELGMAPAHTELTPRSTIPPNWVSTPHGWAGKDNPAWDHIPADRREDLARRMAIYAAMVDRMDQGIGRVVADLEKNGEFSNTLILFLSDNGACAEWDPWGFDQMSGPANVLHTGAALDGMGQRGTYHSTGSGWANASNTPWRLYKHYGHEGGISTPFIVHWPAGGVRKGAIDHRPGHIFDLMPTCLEAAGATAPAKAADGSAALPLPGRSLVPAFRGAADAPRALCFEHEGNRAVRDGRWKLVALKGQPWELYDIDADRTELRNLAAQHPAEVERLGRIWEDWRATWPKQKKKKD